MSRPSKRTTAQISPPPSSASTSARNDPLLQLRLNLQHYVRTLRARLASGQSDGAALRPDARAGYTGQHSAFSACLADLEDALEGKTVERRPLV